MSITPPIVPLDRWRRALPGLAARYQANAPTPHRHLEGFLGLEGLLDEAHAASTDHRSRPGDGWRALPIGLDKKAMAVDSTLRRRLGLSDDFASEVLGWLLRKPKQ